MKNIYVCNSYFHIFITIIKVLNIQANNSIVICNTIPDSAKIIDKLSSSNLFENVYFYDEKNVSEKFVSQNIERKLFRSNQMIKLFENNSNIDFSIYDNVYVYNDWSTIGAYLIDKKVFYHLIEDGVDAFYYIKGNFSDRVTFLNPNFNWKVKKQLKKMLHVGYDFFGQSKYVIDIEVNDKSKIFIKNKNVIEVSKNSLYDSLDDIKKKKICDIFLDQNLSLDEKNKVLILTQPLYADKMVDSLDIQIEIYGDIIKQYKDFVIYIKPHPRDTVCYKKIDHNLKIISKNMPIEVLNFCNKISFKKAITITSSSVSSLNFVEEKIEYGFDFLNKYRKCKEKKNENCLCSSSKIK